MVRPEERPRRSSHIEPAGASPAQTGIGPSGSRPPARGEIAVAEAGRRKPLRREQERGPQHQVKPAASTHSQCGSRAEHVAAKVTLAVRKSEAAPIASPAGVEGAARAQGSVWNRRDPSARPASGQSGAYKPKVKSRRAQRESEGVVVLAMVAQNNAAGGKRPCFGHARRKGKCEQIGIFIRRALRESREFSPAEEGVLHSGKRISRHDGTPTSMRRTAWGISRSQDTREVSA